MATFHPLQKHVLKALCTNRSMRYTQLRPPHVEGNQFSYHLKTLATRGYVKKDSNVYTLTTKGVRYCTEVNLEHFYLRAQPRIVTLIVCQDKEGRLLAYTRDKQPFLGMVGFPYGKIHLGETVENAARRELKEKAGISSSLTHKGMAYLLTTDKDGEVVAHTLAHVFFGTKPSGSLLSPSGLGKIEWLTEKELLAENIMPGVREILSIAKHKGKNLVFEELSFEQV